MSKILTVFGATGKQGGSVIKAVRGNAKLAEAWKIRAVTRDVSKPAAQALAKHSNVEILAANMDDASTVKKAVQGANAVFSVTNFWESMSKDVEVRQAKTIADAAKEAGVKLLIWSSLPHVKRLTNGALVHVDHFDGKAEAEDYIESIKENDMAAAYVQAGFYMSNFDDFVRDNDQAPGTLVFAAPLGNGDKTQIPLIDIAADYGKYVAGVLAASPSEVNGKRVLAVSEWMTPNSAVAAIGKQAGKPTHYYDLDPETFASFMPNEKMGRELKENMLLIRDYSYYGNDTPSKQGESDSFMLNGASKTSLAQYLRQSSKWKSA